MTYTDAYGSERLDTDNTTEVAAKVGTRASRRIYVHDDDLPLSKGDHFRYLNGFRTQEPTDHGFMPEYGKIREIRDDGIQKFYMIDRCGSGSEVPALQDKQNSN